MSKLDDAKEFLSSLNVPKKQQNTMCCCVLLALANLTEGQAWRFATNEWRRIHDIIGFANENYGTTYAENSRESFRKDALHHFRNAAFIEDKGAATNSPNYSYHLTNEMLTLIQSYGTTEWESNKMQFLENHNSLIDLYASKRKRRKMPVKINGEEFTFSLGMHNQLQKAIIEKFAPRFAPNSVCLYVGDTTEKDLVKNEDKLKQAANYYVVYVASQNLKLSELHTNFAAMHSIKVFSPCAETDKITVYQKAIDKFLENYSTKSFQVKYTPEDPIIKTEGNPSSSVVKNIFDSIGLDFTPYETKANYIDADLLSNRHNIVHGNRVYISVDDFDNTFKVIIEIMEQFSTQIISAAIGRNYLR